MPLPFRPVKYKNESIEDYLDRFGYGNGFTSQKKVGRWLDSLFKSTYPKLSGFEVWSRRVLGVEAALNRNICDRLTLAKFGIYKSVPKICPKCWTEEPYIRAYWHIGAYQKCHVHGSTLTRFEGYCSTWYGLSEKYNYHAENDETKKIIDGAVILYGDRSDCLHRILTEQYVFKYDEELVEWLYKFFWQELDIELNKSSALQLCFSGKLVGQSVSDKFSRYFDKISRADDSETQLLLRAIAALKIKCFRIYTTKSHRVSALELMNDWADCEIYSNDQLFFAYIKHYLAPKPEYQKLHTSPISLKNEVDVLNNIHSGADYALGRLLINANLADPYGGAWQGKDIDIYALKFQNDAKQVKKYNEFLIDSGHEVLRSCESY